MKSEARKDWEILCKKCDDLGLPGPAMHPSRLGARWTVYIPGHDFARSAKDVNEAISMVMSYLFGYEQGKTDQAETESRCWRIEAASAYHEPVMQYLVQPGAYNVD